MSRVQDEYWRGVSQQMYAGCKNPTTPLLKINFSCLNGTRHMAKNAVCSFAQNDPRKHPTLGQGQRDPAYQPPLLCDLCLRSEFPPNRARTPSGMPVHCALDQVGNTNLASAHCCECVDANASLCDQKYHTHFGGILMNQRLQNGNADE